MPSLNNIISSTLLLVSTLLLPTSALAVEQCIQAPKRAEPCPHQIYKLMQLEAEKPAKVTCVCLSDFQKFLTEPTDEVEKQLRKLELKGLAADLQLTEQQIKNLAKR